MIIAAHQPNFLPWLGFFDKLRRCDKFLIMDHVQFERCNYQNRTRIRFGEEARWMTVPVVQKSRDELIIDKLVDNDKDWGRKQYATLEHVYRKAPYFRLYGPALKSLLTTEWVKLVDLSIATLRFCMDALEIKTPLVRTSELGPLEGRKSGLVLNMVKAAGGTVYLSGDGGSKAYLDIPAFNAAGVEVRFQDYKHRDYPQGGLKPLHGLSVIDLLFNCGPLSKVVLAGGGFDGLPAEPALGAPFPHHPALPQAPAPRSQPFA